MKAFVFDFWLPKTPEGSKSALHHASYPEMGPDLPKAGQLVTLDLMTGLAPRR